MGALTRAHDWSKEPLGPPDGWPQSLKTTVRLVLSSGHPMLVWWGPQLIQFYNDAHSSSRGADRQPGALGQPGCTCPPEVWREISPRIDQLMAGRGSTWHERHPVPVIYGGRRGDTGWTCSLSPIDEPNAPNGVGGVLMIRQEKTAAPLAGRLAAERHQSLFEHASSFITILRGPELAFEFVNRAFSRLFGSRGFIGRTMREAFPNLGNQSFHERLDAVYASGERLLAHGAPIFLQASPGAPTRRRVLDFICEPMTDEAGRVSGILVEGHDVTDQKQAEMSLRELNATLEHRVRQRAGERDWLWELSEDLLVVADQQGRLLRVSPSWTRLLGHDEPTLMVRTYSDLVHPDDVHTVVDALLAMRSTGRPVSFESRGAVADGTWKWIGWTLSPEPSGERFTGIGRDATATRARQADPEAAQDALRRSRKTDAVGRIVEGIAHGFGNTLQATSGRLEMARRQTAQGRAPGALPLVEMARPDADRAAVPARRLLGLARRSSPDARTVPTDGPVPCDVNHPGGALPGPAVEARDAMADRGTLTLRTFFAARSIGQGTRRGPPRFRGFVCPPGGLVQPDSRARQGTTVRPPLPRHYGDVATLHTQGKAQEDDGDPAGKVVMVVEDENGIHAPIAEALRERGCTVLKAKDGPAALRLVADRTCVDLLVTAVSLSGMDGRRVADGVRERRPGLPVLFITDCAADAVRGQLASAAETIARPFTLEALVARVRSLLAAAEPVAPARARRFAGMADAVELPVIFVVDDDHHVRETIRSVLEDNWAVKDYADGKTFLDAYDGRREACLLVDAHLPGINGLELLRRLGDAGHHLPAIMITGDSDVATAVEAMQAGALDFIEKPISRDRLLAGVSRALQQSHRLALLQAGQDAATGHIASLTTRQRQVMDLVLAGHPSKNIAIDLGISQRTVENHRASIMRKTGSASVPALARLALAAAGNAGRWQSTYMTP